MSSEVNKVEKAVSLLEVNWDAGGTSEVGKAEILLEGTFLGPLGDDVVPRSQGTDKPWNWQVRVRSWLWYTTGHSYPRLVTGHS